MNLDQYRTENPVRFKMLSDAIARLNHEKQVATLDGLRAILPADFDLSSRFDPWQQIAGVTVLDDTAKEAPDTAAKIREALQLLDPTNNEHWTDDGLPREGAVRELVHDTTLSRRDIQSALPGFKRPTDNGVVDDSDFLSAPERKEAADASSRDQLRDRVLELQSDAANYKGVLHGLVEKRSRARIALADAIGSYQSRLAPRVTPSELLHEHAQREHQRRVHMAAHHQSPEQPRPGNSVIDRNAAYSRMGGASAFARKQMQTGHRRGSFGPEMKNARVPPRGQ